MVFAVLEDGAERRGDTPLVQDGHAEATECGRPVDRLGHTWRLVEVEVTHRLDRRCDLPGQLVGTGRHPQAHDRDLAVEFRVLDPMVEAPTFERVVHVTGAVRRQHHQRWCLGAEHAELGHRDLEVGEHLEEVGLELVVGPVDFVDQEDRWRAVAAGDRPQERPFDEKPFLVQIGLDVVRRPT